MVSSKEKLISECAICVDDEVEHQFEKVAYFNKEVSEDIKEKLKHAPLMNSGCESRMSESDVQTKFTGGKTLLATISDKQIVKVNGYLKTSDFNTDEGTSRLFKWARTSRECRIVKEINEEFREQVHMTKVASLKAKSEAKKKKAVNSCKAGIAAQRKTIGRS